jgi:hypothetical protein
MNNTIEYLNKNDGSIGIDGILRANGDFPLTNANQVKGGMHHFNTIQERDAMPILKASPGMLAYVIETDIHYKLIYENDSFVWKKIVDREEIQTFFNGGEGITYNNNTGEISLTYLRSNNNVLEYSDGENWNSVIGDITSINVTTGLGLQGGASGTIGDITGNISLNHLGLENLIDPNSNSIFYWNNLTKKSEFLNIGDGLLINSGVLSNTIINNNQLINGSGYITGIDWNEISGNQSDINLSGFTNDIGFSTFDGDYNSLTNIPTYTQGSIIFADSDGSLTENNNQLYWDNVNNRLGINTTSPTEKLDVNGNIKADGTLKLYDITDAQTINLNPDGDSFIDGDLIIGDSNTNRTVKLTDDGLYISRTADGGHTSQIKANSNSNSLDISVRSNIYFKHNNEGVTSLTLYDYGHVQMPTYGQGNVSGVTQYLLGVDLNGTIIESEWLTNDNSSTSIRIGKGIPSVFEKSYVTLIGHSAGKNASVINNFNTLIGTRVGFDSGTFQNATIIGNGASSSGNDYQNSVIIGEQAGQQIGLNNSVAIGYRNGFSTTPQGSFNNTITIGAFVTPTADGQIIIGNNSNTSFETFGQMKNSTYGQNNIVSDFITDETSLPVFDIDGNIVESQVISINDGNVGIGTTSPQTSLSIGDGTTANVNVHLNKKDNNNAGYYIVNDVNISGRTVFIRQTIKEDAEIGTNNSNNLSLLTNDTVRLYIDGATQGNVGIGTSSPTEKLDVIGNIKADGILKLFDVTNTQKIELNPDEASYINGGNVGIGTTTPSHKLTVNGDISIDSDRFIRFGTALGMQKKTNNEFIFFGGTNSSEGGFHFKTFSNSAYVDGSLVLRNNGNVGIGTSSPSVKLDVAGDIIARDTYPSIYLDHSGTVLGGIRADSTNKLEFKTLTTAPLSFQVNLSEKMRITDGGNVGIGTINPTEKLDVNGNIKSSGYINGKRCGAAGYLASPVNVTVTTANTYYPIGVFTVPVAEDFVVGTTYPNGLKYNGTIAQTFHITWNATIESTSNNVTATIDIQKNGVSIAMSKMGTYAKTGGEIYNLSGQCVVDLDTNDEVRFVVTADKNNEGITFDYFTASIKEFFD